jgi:hypothetical protein
MSLVNKVLVQREVEGAIFAQKNTLVDLDEKLELLNSFLTAFYRGTLCFKSKMFV